MCVHMHDYMYVGSSVCKGCLVCMCVHRHVLVFVKVYVVYMCVHIYVHMYIGTSVCECVCSVQV